MEVTNKPVNAFASTKEFAQVLGIPRRNVTRMCAMGYLPAVKIGTSWYINAEKALNIKIEEHEIEKEN